MSASQTQPGQSGPGAADLSAPDAATGSHLTSRRLRWAVVGLLAVLFVGLAANLLFTFAPARAATWFGAAQEDMALIARGIYDASAVLVLLSLLAWVLATRRDNALLRAGAQAHDDTARLPIGIATWDAQDRLVACNDAFRGLYPEVAARIEPGITYLDLVRAYYRVAPAEVIDGRSLDRFVADCEHRRAAPQVSEVVRHHRGRWLLTTDVRNVAGGIVSVRMEVAEPRLVDLEMRRRRKVIEDLAELTADWYWRVDADGRLVEVSEAMAAALQSSVDQLMGRALQELPGFSGDTPASGALRERLGSHDALAWTTVGVTRPDGSMAWLAFAGRPVFDAANRFAGYYGAGRDVTERESTMAKLRQSEARFRALTELATEWYWETDAQLKITLLQGPCVDEAHGQALVGRSLASFGDDPNYKVDRTQLEAHLRRREPFRRLAYRIERRDGKGPVYYYESSAEPLYVDGQFVGYRGLSWDVSERERTIALLRESEERFRALTELSSDWYWETDADLRFTSVRQGGNRPLPFEEADLVGRHRWDLPGDLVSPSTWEEHRADLEARRPFRDVIVRRVDRNGKTFFTLTAGDPFYDGAGRFVGYRGIGRNITDQVGAQERIERLATIDPLTQLYNRSTFDERAGKVLADAYAQGKLAALLFLDLDNFRLLNNGYGHRVGDQMLSTVAARMRQVIGEPHLLGRRGGDELVALLVDIPRVEVAVDTAKALIAAIGAPARVSGMEVSVTPSVGVGIFPQDGVDLDSLLNAADAAMYQAKESGRRTYAFYTPAVARKSEMRLRLEQRLRQTVETRDFKLFYQPLVSLFDGKMIGAECLIRWKDAELGEIRPDEFVKIAEESGLIVELGDWVLREACRARQVWHGLGLDVPPLSVNMAGAQLDQLQCVDRLLETLAEFGVAPSEIEIEVTETGLFQATEIGRENLVRLRNAGVKLALDDFGVGYSSLSHLRELPIHRLKIDRTFTVECMRDARTLTIVKAVIEMARSLGINVTAEGIETQAQQTWMQHLGCDSAQGFLFARPMPAEEFLKLFIDRRGVGRERSLMH